MNEIKLGAIESRFADIIWNNEPLRPKELEALAEAELGWKRTTTLTILKRLCERGIFQNKERIITSLMSREEFYALQSEKFVNDTFEGSLPAFLAAFGSRKKLSQEEVEELKKVIDKMRG
ncbi:MAG: BlaI/MecI/CopY family transcriptional regulator [Lachnospiraceae bacterium]|nr:BlaI/MecI/CopY family transcriptional regulator [Lachnospiraceae bacterium]